MAEARRLTQVSKSDRKVGTFTKLSSEWQHLAGKVSWYLNWAFENSCQLVYQRYLFLGWALLSLSCGQQTSRTGSKSVWWEHPSKWNRSMHFVEEAMTDLRIFFRSKVRSACPCIRVLWVMLPARGSCSISRMLIIILSSTEALIRKLGLRPGRYQLQRDVQIW